MQWVAYEDDLQSEIEGSYTTGVSEFVLGHNYSMNFTIMCQTNIHTLTTRLVRRIQFPTPIWQCRLREGWVSFEQQNELNAAEFGATLVLRENGIRFEVNPGTLDCSKGELRACRSHVGIPTDINGEFTWMMALGGGMNASVARSVNFGVVAIIEQEELRDVHLDNEATCSLCFDGFTKEGSTSVKLRACLPGHYFHRDCGMNFRISEVVARMRRCPVCSVEYM